MTSVIYVPRGRAREYSALALNVYSGCSHGCRYCYVPELTSRTYQEFQKSGPRPDFLENLEKDARRLAGTDKRVLLSFTTDPYHGIESIFGLTRKSLEILRKYDIPFQVLTKGGARALVDIDLYGDRDQFACTLTFLDDSTSKQWEPYAALPADRIDTLKKFHKAGIGTWVSLEPVISPEQSLAIIDLTYPFVDLYKVGKLNHSQLHVDWRKFGMVAIDRLNELGKLYYIKNDLRKHLPKNYKNFGNASTEIAQSRTDQEKLDYTQLSFFT